MAYKRFTCIIVHFEAIAKTIEIHPRFDLVLAPEMLKPG